MIRRHFIAGACAALAAVAAPLTTIAAKPVSGRFPASGGALG
jgi:hypothetical protein